MKRIKKNLKKSFSIFMVIGVLLTFIGIPPFLNVHADTNNTAIELQSNNGTNTISIDENDSNKLVYKIGEVIVGYAKVKVGSVYKTPVMNAGKAVFALDQYVEEYQVDVELTSVAGYDPQPSYFYDGSSDNTPGPEVNGVRIIHATISKNNIHSLDISFEAGNSGGGQTGPEPVFYPIVAYFGNDMVTQYEPNHEGKIIIPDSWTSGKITFKAIVCDNGETISPYTEYCPVDSSEIPVRPMIANSDQINKQVTPVQNQPGVLNATNDFLAYGKLALHVVKERETDPEINSIIAVEASNLINIRAVSPLGMSDFIGSDYLNQAIYTKAGERDASIFFGNTETTLIASGNNVQQITAVRGASLVSSSIIGGEANLVLPDLSVETTTSVEVDIKLTDNSTITRNLNIKRTALFLERGDYSNGLNQVRAGYVLHKDYLYNDVDGFDAHLQVIFYKDNAVVGYKQIQIEDESLANSLSDINPNGFMNTFDWDGYGERPLYDPIIIYNEEDGDPEGVNKISIFLTNGSIDYDSNILPSIEFGIGAGLEMSWEAE